MFKRLIIIIIFFPLSVKSQLAYRTKLTQEVFNNLVQAFANGKGAPDLRIIPLHDQQVIAEYSTLKGIPVIQIDQKLINICFSLGKDSLNALAFILAHELSHYYKDDNWCMDYAGFKYKTNPAFAKEIKSGEKINLGKEIIADKEGILYATIAGFSPFNIFKTLIDSIYLKYNLKSNLQGYPSKEDRIGINIFAQKEARTWLEIFNSSLLLISNCKYQAAIDKLNALTKKFPSREVYNNLGIAKTRKALMLNPKNLDEIKFPEKFKYPLEVDINSRLIQNNTRGINDSSNEYEKLLSDAQKCFQEAIRIDSKYFAGYINLACVYDLLGNYSAAIGEINKLPLYVQGQKAAKQILAIALYHNGENEKADRIWNSIQN